MSEVSEPVGVCGVGASAGGVEPLVELIGSLPADCGFAIVVVQHLSPNHESMMSALLQRRAAMPVRQVVDDDELQPGHVYVLGPGDEVTLGNGHLRVKDRPVLLEGSRSPHPIDLFFKSLAKRGSRACAIVLSGTGSDGAEGIKAVRQTGGLTLAQDDSALFADMPRAALDSGFLDAIGDPAELAQHVVSFMAGEERPEVGSHFEPVEREILTELEAATGVSFEDYKRGTIHRRLEQEVQRLGLDSLGALGRRLQTSPSDCADVARQLLIGVTTFFRNPMVFGELADTAVDPLLIQADKDNRAVRVWTAGCATGQEAYSIAMILLEAKQRLGLDVPIKVFATDVHDGFLALAREGTYTEDQMTEVDPERRTEFFTATADGWRVTPELRGVVAFSQHNLLSDAPFTRIDLMVCRNTLIYFTRNAQMNAMWAFGFALRQGGILMLGDSEMLGSAVSDFVELSSPGCLFRKVDDQVTSSLRRSRGPLDIRLAPPRIPRPVLPVGARPSMASRAPLPTQKVTIDAHELMAKELGIGGLVFNESRELTRIIGSGVDWLRFAAGPAPTDGIALVEDPILRGGVESILHQMANGDVSPVQPITVTVQGKRERLVLRGGRVPGKISNNTLVYASPVHIQADLVGEESETGGPESVDGPSSIERVEWLEKELAMAREQLHTMLEQRDSSLADLAATNEELVVSNEELQTSIEELSSVNEELRTMADENEARLTEVLELGSDLEQILDAIDIGIILLNADLTIRRYSEPSSRYFHLVRTDLGRPFSHIRPDFDVGGLADAVNKAVVSGVATSLRSDTTRDETRTLLINVRPYHIARGELGCSITVADVTTSQFRELEKTTERMKRVLRATGFAVWERSVDRTTRWGSDNFEEVVGFSVDEWLDFPNIDAIHPDDRKTLAALLDQQRQSTSDGLLELDMDYRVRDGSDGYRVVNARAVAALEGKDASVWGISRDATEERERARRLVELNGELIDVNDQLVHANKQVSEFARVASRDLRQPISLIQAEVDLVLQDPRVSQLPADDTCAVLLSNVSTRTQVLSELLEEFLDFATVGPDQSGSAHVDLLRLSELVVSQIEVPQGIAIDLRADVVNVQVEQVPFRACLRNLVANAARNSEGLADGIQVDISHRKSADGPGSVHVVLSDLGSHAAGPTALQAVEERFRGGSEIELQLVQRILDGRNSELEFAIDDDGRAILGFEWPLSSDA